MIRSSTIVGFVCHFVTRMPGAAIFPARVDASDFGYSFGTARLIEFFLSADDARHDPLSRLRDFSP
jgi:hypothetical protein